MTTRQSPDLVAESDRGCVLVGAAILESKLEELFREEFQANQVPKKLQDSIFDSNGPLSTFSAKIKLAYSLGYIGREVFDDLETIRKIRNDFAHSPLDVDFIGNDVSDIIERMHCVQPLKDEMPRYSPKTADETATHLVESKIRMMGYIKRTKGLFSLGVLKLEIEILKCQTARMLARHA